MKVRGLKTIRRGTTWLRGRFGRSALILGYHRVAETAVDPFNIAIHPDHFAQQLDALRQMADVVDLETLRCGLQSGNLPRRTVAVTFDDGYQDNLTAALPLLAARNLPATLFAISGAPGQVLWWEELGRLILETAVLPDSLSLQIGGQPFTWEVTDSRYATARKPAILPRRHLFQQLYGLLGRWREERPLLLTQLQTWAFSAGSTPPTAARALTHDELKSMAAHPLITIGAHTVSHPQLSTLPPAAQREEIEGSKTSLEAVLNQPVSFFSFPHGDCPPVARVLVQEAGYTLACTSVPDVVRPHSDLYSVPRFWPTDTDGATFARWLRRWLERH
ncbi:MAG: polysaccharide deacetylase family protein [Chloroflexota bacterium]